MLSRRGSDQLCYLRERQAELPREQKAAEKWGQRAEQLGPLAKTLSDLWASCKLWDFSIHKLSLTLRWDFWWYSCLWIFFSFSGKQSFAMTIKFIGWPSWTLVDPNFVLLLVLCLGWDVCPSFSPACLSKAGTSMPHKKPFKDPTLRGSLHSVWF